MGAMRIGSLHENNRAGPTTAVLSEELQTRIEHLSPGSLLGAALLVLGWVIHEVVMVLRSTRGS